MIPMPRTRIKICGIVRPEDGAMAAELGADAIGLVFHPASARYVTADGARQIIRALPPLVATVGLFMNADAAAVRAVLQQVPLQWLQFHGDEDPDYCADFGLPYIKAVPMGAGADIDAYQRRFAGAAGLLLDSHGGTGMGGTGQTFDWSRIPAARHKPLILAGGLHPGNVAAAVHQVRPYAVDVSSGVETAKGVKNAALMRAFIRGVNDCESDA